MVALKSIANKFDVRLALDQDRVLQFVSLYESGADVPPVKLVALDEDSYAYIDGRHRGAARAYLDLPDVPALICNGSLRENPVELYAEALEANWGGAKPPTRDDIVHTIGRMLEAGATQTVCRERLAFLPAGALRAFIAQARGSLSKRRIAKALDAVSDGFSVPVAAQQFGVKPELLKDIIAGKKGKWGTGRSNEDQLATEIKAYISRQLFSANAGISKKIQDLLARVSDGEVSGKVAIGVIRSWHEHLRKTSLRIDDWTARLASISEEQNKAVAAGGGS
jgi:hypothetical protein